jgi:hypothetical protein
MPIRINITQINADPCGSETQSIWHTNVYNCLCYGTILTILNRYLQGNLMGKNEKHVQKNVSKIFSIIIFPSQYNA